MPTKTELAQRVMRRIGALDPSENQTAAEDADVQLVMDSVYSSLKERGQIEWVLTDIPVRFQDAFINVVADRVAPDFGMSTQETQLRGQIGLKELFALAAIAPDTRATDPVVDY